MSKDLKHVMVDGYRVRYTYEEGIMFFMARDLITILETEMYCSPGGVDACLGRIEDSTVRLSSSEVEVVPESLMHSLLYRYFSYSFSNWFVEITIPSLLEEYEETPLPKDQDGGKNNNPIHEVNADKFTKAADLFNRAMKVAQGFGLEGGERNNAANTIVKSLTGVDLLRLMRD